MNQEEEVEDATALVKQLSDIIVSFGFIPEADKIRFYPNGRVKDNAKLSIEDITSVRSTGFYSPKVSIVVEIYVLNFNKVRVGIFLRDLLGSATLDSASDVLADPEILSKMITSRIKDFHRRVMMA